MPSVDENGKPLGGAALVRERKAAESRAAEHERARRESGGAPAHTKIADRLGPCPASVAGTTNYAHQAAGQLLELVLRDPVMAFEDKLKHATSLMDSIGKTATKAAVDERVRELEAENARLKGQGRGATTNRYRNPLGAVPGEPDRGAGGAAAAG